MHSDAVRDFFDALAPDWDGRCSHDENKIERILDAADIYAGSRVLDVGCGTGVLFPYYFARGALSVTGMDISPAMLAQAEQKLQDPRLTLRLGDAAAADFAAEFDCCVVYSAFPHFFDPEALVASLARALCPNGRLCIAHSESRACINARHAGGAKPVSRLLPSAAETAALLRPYFRVDTVVDDETMYIVCGEVL